jgi:Protein kinase domain/AAA ATPase domain
MTDPYADFKSAVSAQYVIEGEIGVGGMATVYLARDVRHDRPVALKVFRPEVAASIGSDRFLSEITTTANFQHPHVLPLYESGEAAGLLYYVMPFVDGATLSERMSKERQFSIADTVRIVSAVAAALHYAHRQGVIHRDIKPANILLSDGMPVVADFGIAIAVDAAADERLTATGLSMGTPHYMSPEQATGEGEIDARADIYALGCVAYEMLTGEPPHPGANAQAIIAKKLTQAPTPVRTLRPTVPEHVEAAVLRSLELVAADRFQTAEEFAAGLRGDHAGADDAASTGASSAAPVAPATAETPVDWTVPRLVLARPHALVGRTQERKLLTEHLDRALDGNGSFVLIGGEPGVGKTRLAEEILQEAMDRGAMVVIGHCTEIDSATPYTPIVEILDYAVRSIPGEVLRPVLGDAASEIARLLPSLRDTFSDIPPAPDLPPEAQRRNLFQRYREFLERASQVTPIVALYDDLHWSDESTLLLLEHLAPHFAGLPMLSIGTYRDVELEVGRPFARTMSQLARQGLAERILLRRMPESEVADLLATLGGAAPPSTVVQAVFHGTEGNPFFVGEVFRHLDDEGRLFDDQGAWRSDLSASELDVPEGVRLVIGRRLEHLSADTRKALGPCAIVGPRFDPRIVEELGVLDPDALLDAFDEAEGARLIRSHSSGRTAMYGFTHELIRQTLLDNLSTPRTQRWHLRIAEAIQRAYPKGLERHAAELAHHLYEAGAAADVDEARLWSTTAGRQAVDAAAFEEGLGHVERAYSVDEDAPPPDQTLALERIRAEALFGIGEWDGARAVWLHSLEIASDLSDIDAFVEIVMDLGIVLLWLDDNGTASDVAGRGLKALGESEDSRRALLLSLFGIATAAGGDYSGGMAAIIQAEEIARKLDDDEVLARALLDRQLCSWNFAYVDDAAAFGAEAARFFREVANPLRRLDAQMWQLQAELGQGNLENIKAHAGLVRSAGAELGHAGAALLADRCEMDVALHVGGDWVTFEEFALRGRTEWTGVGPWIEFAEFLLAFARLNRRELSETYAMICEAGARFPKDNLWSPALEEGRFWWGVRTNAPDLDERADIALRGLPSLDGHAFVGRWFAVSCNIEAFARLGRLDEAASLYPLQLRKLEMGYRMDVLVLGDTCAGIAAAAGGNWDLALRHFGEARVFCEREKLVVFLASLSYWHGWMLIQRGENGDLENAKELLDDARARFDALGMMLDVDGTDRLIAGIT